MKLFRLTSPILLPSRLSWNSLFPYHHYHTMSDTPRNPSTTDIKKNYNNKPRGNFKNHPPKDKKPPLTHFLCLPLVNSISLPQLESSLATFKAAIPVSPSSSLSASRGGQNDAQPKVIVREQKPLIPDGALRPVGTLHLTLGVMSLPTKERLDEALGFFQSLNLADMLHEAEDKAQQSISRHSTLEQVSSSTDKPGNDTIAATSAVSRSPPQPFNISLESLHALPRARSATVLHATPIDPTFRLYPFCEMLRDKFLEAGFLLGENESPSQQGQADENRQGKATEEVSQQGEESKTDIGDDGGQLAAENNSVSSNTDTPINTKLLQSCILKELPINTAEEPSTKSQAQPPKPTTRPIHIPHKLKSKPRPLLLHATVVNTIYIKGRQRNAGRGGKGNNKKNNNTRYTFDARDILDHYRDYYLDSHRTTPQSAAVTVAGARARDTPMPPGDMYMDTLQRDSDAGGLEDEDPEQKKTSSRSGNNSSTSSRNATFAAKKPFLWARDFPLESVCICEMGAKKLDPNEGGLNARLGETYRVVAEKSMYGNDSSETNPIVPEHGSSGGSLERSVNVSG